MPTKSKSLTTTKRKPDGAELEEGARMPALHPGEMLREEFMKPLGLSSNALAMELRVPVTRISEIVRERRGITADTALRLARYFNMSPEFWMRLQMDFDLENTAAARNKRQFTTRFVPELGMRPRRPSKGGSSLNGSATLEISTVSDPMKNPAIAGKVSIQSVTNMKSSSNKPWQRRPTRIITPRLA